MTKKSLIVAIISAFLFGGIITVAHFIKITPVGYEKTPVAQIYEKEIVEIKANSENENITVRADDELCRKIIQDGTFDFLKEIKYSRREKENFESALGQTEIQIIFSDDTILFIKPYGEAVNLNRIFYIPDIQLHGFAESLYNRIKDEGDRI